MNIISNILVVQARFSCNGCPRIVFFLSLSIFVCPFDPSVKVYEQLNLEPFHISSKLSFF